MQESAGVLSLPSLGAAPLLDLPPPHRERWPHRVAAAAAALLLHGLVLLLIVWPLLSSVLWPQKPPPVEVAIPITIVQAPPKPPPPPPAQQEPRARRSGSEDEGGLAESGKGESERTTAPEAVSPPAPPPTPEAAPSPEPASPPEAASPPAPAETESAGAPPSAEQSAAVPLPAVKPPIRLKQKVERKTAPVSASVARRAGDRYLNAVRDRIERVRSYPPLARGRQLRGLAIYAVTVDREGRLLDVRLLESSGYDMLDREGERMIRAAAPLPALPDEVAAGRAEVQFGIDIPLYPN